MICNLSVCSHTTKISVSKMSNGCRIWKFSNVVVIDTQQFVSTYRKFGQHIRQSITALVFLQTLSVSGRKKQFESWNKCHSTTNTHDAIHFYLDWQTETVWTLKQVSQHYQYIWRYSFLPGLAAENTDLLLNLSSWWKNKMATFRLKWIQGNI